uniref:Uncharacterized protein n=1 Tax=Ciona savignyi TaxID=51511 RepID=H2YVA1_CIOSA
MLMKNESSTLHLDEVLCILQSQFQNKIFLLNVEPKKENKKRNLNDYFGRTETKAKKFKADENLNDLSSEDEIQQKLNRLQSSNTYEVDKVASTVAGGVEGVWRSVEEGMLVYESVGIKHSSRVVAFDLDSTLISTKSGKRFATDYEDWKIMLPLIPKKLKQLAVVADVSTLTSQLNMLSITTGSANCQDHHMTSCHQ